MIIVEKEYLQMTKSQRKDYCGWCFYKSYGDCNKCSIYLNKDKD